MTKKILFFIIAFSSVAICAAQKSLYNFTVSALTGEAVNLSDYKGKVLLIVNTASKCGLTPQFEQLEKLYEKYNSDGFVVLGFPCNQFRSQDPGTPEEILKFCKETYNVTFPLFQKSEVNGENTIPLYKFLKKQLPLETGSNDIRWNFEKFLIDKNGTPFQRYAPNVKPETLEEEIVKLLAN
jgi:glutathione peroxidase